MAKIGKISLRISLRTKFILVFLTTLFIAVFLTSFLSYQQAKNALEDQMGERLLGIARTSAIMIKGDKHNTLKTVADEQTPNYKELKQQLIKIRDDNKATYVYTMARREDGKIVFVVDAAEGEDMSHIGDEYEADPDIETALGGTSTFSKEMTTDKWGTFKSGLAPFRDSTGKIVGVIGVDIAADQVLTAEKQLLFRYIFAGAIAALLGIIMSILFARYLTRSMTKMVATMADIADMKGDLTKEIKVNSSDEIGEMAGQFNRMLANLRVLIGEIQNSIKQVAVTSTHLSDSANEASHATDEIKEALAATVSAVEHGSEQQQASVADARQVMDQFSESLQQVATGAAEQAVHVNNASEYVNQIAEEISNVAAGSATVAQSSARTAQAAQAGQQVVSSTMSGMSNIREIVRKASQTIEELGSRSAQIGEIIQVIDDIAAQTNLLALNAAIEAARAGEHGKGFAVVADEVRRLAESSSQSTREISELVVHITKGIDDSVIAMGNVSGEVEQGFEQSSEAERALGEILQLAETVNKQVQQITDATNVIAGRSTEMVTAIHNVAAIVEENSSVSANATEGSLKVKEVVDNISAVSGESARAVREVGASGETMGTVVERIAESAEQLAEMATKLAAMTDQFKVGP